MASVDPSRNTMGGVYSPFLPESFNSLIVALLFCRPQKKLKAMNFRGLRLLTWNACQLPPAHVQHISIVLHVDIFNAKVRLDNLA
ncbi:hypothetical protein L861_02650 [Litchfieldella anticariensis FP35 = DSM 16096]|uniref:Uncharacterized protein n=1 Tax=Litchfieldella anticariensis (strain DSM 16096 / CECT 5854 / CIP 108499 / LMG 22089 / FP35) TaxID=1121939 RepID=S2KUH6_LITA3|nr:hypothetical protein L861_02650 [Halomonas anticariensis FP35 = DSM 16096]